MGKANGVPELLVPLPLPFVLAAAAVVVAVPGFSGVALLSIMATTGRRDGTRDTAGADYRNRR